MGLCAGLSCKAGGNASWTFVKDCKMGEGEYSHGPAPPVRLPLYIGTYHTYKISKVNVDVSLQVYLKESHSLTFTFQNVKLALSLGRAASN